MSSFDPDQHSYESVEDIPTGTILALEEEGTLYLKCVGADDEWLSAELRGWNVSANTQNNR